MPSLPTSDMAPPPPPLMGEEAPPPPPSMSEASTQVLTLVLFFNILYKSSQTLYSFSYFIVFF